MCLIRANLKTSNATIDQRPTVPAENRCLPCWIALNERRNCRVGRFYRKGKLC